VLSRVVTLRCVCCYHPHTIGAEDLSIAPVLVVLKKRVFVSRSRASLRTPECVAFWGYFLCIVGLLVYRSYDPLSWIDEFGPIFIRGDTYGETIQIINQYGQHPPLFGLIIHWVSDTFGTSPVFLRLPSLLGWIGAVLVFRRFVAVSFCPLVADAAALLLITSRLGQSTAAMCRPYGLAMLCVATVVLCFYYATTRRSWGWALAACFAYLGAVGFHVLYLPLALCFVVYGLMSLGLRLDDTKLNQGVVVFSFVSFVSAVVLYFPLISRLWLRRDHYSYIPLPVGDNFIKILPLAVIGFVILNMCLFGSRRFTLAELSRPIVRLSASLLLVFWFTPFLLSFIAGASIFLERHLGPAYLAFSLMPFLFVKFDGLKSPFLYISLVFFLAVQIQGRWLVDPGSDFSQGAVALIERVSPGDAVIFGSGYVEAARASNRSDPFERELLVAPLSFYGFKGVALPLPTFENMRVVESTPVGESIKAEIQAIQAPRVFLLGEAASFAHYAWWVPLVAPQYKLIGWESHGSTLLFEFGRDDSRLSSVLGDKRE
jgi:hypothetical protein